MKKFISVFTSVVMLCSLYLFPSFTYAKNNLNTDEIDKLCVKYNIQRVNSSQVPKGVKPIIVNNEQELKKVCDELKAQNKNNINNFETIQDEVTPGTGESFGVTFIDSLTRRTDYSQKINLIGTKVTMVATIHYDDDHNVGFINNETMSLEGMTVGSGIDNIIVNDRSNGSSATITGECALSSYVIFKASWLKISSLQCEMNYTYDYSDGFTSTYNNVQD